MINAIISDSFTLDTRVLVLQTSRLPLVGKHIGDTAIIMAGYVPVDLQRPHGIFNGSGRVKAVAQSDDGHIVFHIAGKYIDEYVFYDQNRRRMIADRDVNGNNAIYW